MITRSEYNDWRRYQATEEFKKEIKEVIQEVAAEVLNRKESNTDRDMFCRGMIFGFSNAMQWEPQVFADEVTNND